MAHMMHEKDSGKRLPEKVKSSFSHKFVAFLSVVTVVYAVFLAYSTANLAGDQSLLDENIQVVEAEMQQLEADQVENLMVAGKAMEQIESVDVKWSEVLSLLLDATPDDIVYRSYAGNENGTITMAVLAQSFDRVADLIDILQNKPFIESAFVPSVVKGTSPTNAATYSFSLNVKYKN